MVDHGLLCLNVVNACMSTLAHLHIPQTSAPSPEALYSLWPSHRAQVHLKHALTSLYIGVSEWMAQNCGQSFKTYVVEGLPSSERENAGHSILTWALLHALRT